MNAFALDREAFSFTNYDLNVQIDPEQHRLGVRGKITLRNDSPTPQKIAVLQISSSLDWRSVKAGDKAVQFVSQPYTSDIDHTGSLSEAIVTLPQAIAPNGTIELDIAYEGVILLDATRLTRIGTPEEAANEHRLGPDRLRFLSSARSGQRRVVSDCDRGCESCPKDDSLFEVLDRWKNRESAAENARTFRVSRDDGEAQELLINETSCKVMYEQMRTIFSLQCRLHVSTARFDRASLCDG